jgi:hypothetical protein
MQRSQIQSAGYGSQYARLDREYFVAGIGSIVIIYLKPGNLNQPTLATDQQCRTVKWSGRQRAFASIISDYNAQTESRSTLYFHMGLKQRDWHIHHLRP